MDVPLLPDLVQLGWDEARADELRQAGVGGDRPGRVVRVDRGMATVRTAEGDVRATTATLAEAPAVGDWVVVDDEPRATALLRRRSRLARRDAGGAATMQVLAANVDTVLLLHPLDGPPNLRRIERELVAAWESGATPVVVLTKADLVAPDEAELWRTTVADVAPGVDVLVVSSTTGLGLEDLGPSLAPGRTVVLLGPSGAGKSSLVNALAGVELAAIGEVRAGDRKGRHTTVASELLPLDAGGLLIDTPGLRALALWEAEVGLELAFADVDELATRCRFSDCAHDREPGCAVQQAVEDGTLPAGRLDSWQRLRAELDRLDRDRDARAKADDRRRDKVQQKALRTHYKQR